MHIWELTSETDNRSAVFILAVLFVQMLALKRLKFCLASYLCVPLPECDNKQVLFVYGKNSCKNEDVSIIMKKNWLLYCRDAQNWTALFPPFSSHRHPEASLTKYQFGQESCPAREYLHSEQLWMLEKVSAAHKSTPTTIPQTPHISKNPFLSWTRLLAKLDKP